MFVFRTMDLDNTVLGWLWGDGYQEDDRLPCLRDCGLLVHDKLIDGLRVCSLSTANVGSMGCSSKPATGCHFAWYLVSRKMAKVEFKA
jgi:hypothetical protein